MPLNYGLIHHVDLVLQELPSSLQGVKIAHLTDLHITRHTHRHDRLMNQLTSLRIDMALFTGDYMRREDDHVEAAAVLRRIVDAANPRFGSFGVFGNHDSRPLVDLVQDVGIHWLGTGSHRLEQCPIHLFGLDPLHKDREDSTAMLLNGGPVYGQDSAGYLRLMLAHYPSWLSTAADLGMHVLFSGHTHGGQMRLPTGRALINACDLPLDISCGVLRHRDTLIAISRGLGEVGPPGARFRLFCPPHVPVYTLRQGPTLGQHTQKVVKVVSW